MTNLRSKLIRLAHAKPELRLALLPILTKTAAKDEVTHKIVTTYKDSTGKEQTSTDSWLPKWGKPTKANFEKIVAKGLEEGGTTIEAKLVSRGETLFTHKPKTASIGRQEKKLPSGWVLKWNPAQANRMSVDDEANGSWSDNAILVPGGKILFDFPERIPPDVKNSVKSFFREVSRKSSTGKLLRFPEGVMTEMEWVQRYADRVEEYKKTPDFDRRKYNQMNAREQEAYDAKQKEKAKKPGYRAWKGDTFYDISKDTFEWSKREGIRAASEDKEAIRGPFSMPRSSYIPKDEPTLQKRKNTPEGLEIWTWESYSRGQDRVVPYAIAFAGKADKPLWHHSFRDVNGQERMIQETIKSHEYRLEQKRQRVEEKKNFKHGLQIGDILYSSWGYDQTNIDFYQVTKLYDKAVGVREIGKKVTSEGQGSDKVVADPGHFVGPELKKIPQGSYGSVYLRISSSQSAYKWDGRPLHETSAGWGH